MKTINIYLKPNDKKELCRLQNKFHLSFSTMANAIITPIYVALGQKLNEKLYNEKNYKTCIKPRQDQYSSKQYTNAIKLFLRKDLKKYVDEQTNQKITQMIYKEFQNTYDENWNGNRWCRFIPKFIKKNPTYIRNLIENAD